MRIFFRFIYKKRKEKASIFCLEKKKNGRKKVINQIKENKKIDGEKERLKDLYDEIDVELMARATWCGRECVLVYLHDLCDDLLRSMHEIGLDTSDLEKARKEAEEELVNFQDGNGSLNAFLGSDKNFFKAFEKAFFAFGVAIGM